MKKITYRMPNNNGAEEFVSYIAQILNLHETKETLALHTSDKSIYIPTTEIAVTDTVTQPNILFADSKITPISAGVLQIGSSEQKTPRKGKNKTAISLHKENIGKYIKEENNGQNYYWLSIAELARRLKDTNVTLDHTGINIPTKLLSKEKWENLIAQLSKEAVLFDYPGEPWPFIIPATTTEQTGEISDTKAKREPKFELVYDQYTPIPLIQFAVGTNLSQQEVQELFPGPYAETFPSLAHLFKAVYIYSPWDGLAIRFDIGYAGDRTEDKLLRYLLTEGKRREKKESST